MRNFKIERTTADEVGGRPPSRRRRRVSPAGALTIGITVSALVFPATISATSASAASTTPPVLKEGGSMTVLETGSLQGAWPQGIDPGTDADGGSNQDLEDAVFGSMFELGTGGVTVPDLATGYKFLDGGRTVELSLRHGVKFSDGTPFNAAAVVYNYDRDFRLKAANLPPWPVAKTNAFTAPTPYTVDIHLTAPYSPIINSMHSRNVNWIGSPTAIKKLGDKKFAITPVGAGPFTVVSDTVSSELVVKKNPLYWQKGLPYLDNLTFKAVASDESALEAMQGGQAQAYVLMSTLQLVKTFQSSYTVTTELSSSPLDVQMNMKIAPFNNLVAREALYYATNSPLLAQKLYAGETKAVQGFTAPGDLFYSPTVPGYRTYDLAKAKALVKQAGGISFTLLAGNSGTQKTLAEAMQSMWQAAGMQVKLNLADLPSVIQGFDSGKWQADESGDGAFDPATGVAQMFRFLSTSVFSGIHDPKLDTLLNAGTAAPTAQRNAIYKKVAQYESDHAYVVQLYPAPEWNIADKDVSAPGLTSVFPQTIDVPEIWWQYAGYKK